MRTITRWAALLALLAGCGQNPGAVSGGRTAPDLGGEADMAPQEDAADLGQEDAPDQGEPDLDGTGGFVYPTRWEIWRAPDAPEAVGWAADDLARAFAGMGLEVSPQVTADAPRCQEGLGVVALGGDGLEAPPLPEGATEQTWTIQEERCGDGGALLRLGGGGLLGRQYAAYELLHQLGVRAFHPERDYIPRSPRWPEAPLQVVKTPDFLDRSVSLHLTHPLELGDPWRLGDARYNDEVRRYIDWEVKNLASLGKGGLGDGALASYGYRRGFPRMTGFDLHNQQQGGRAILDPDDPRTEEEQLAAAIDARMGPDPSLWPKYFGFTFNPSEFTELDDRDTVRQISFIADYIGQHYPGTIVNCINHGTAGAPTAHYGVRFYDLPKFAPENLGVRVHTLMFYDLFRPAPVYGNQNFNHLFDFMVEQYQRRELWYFPESAWWLTFDIAVPLYLPITLEARHRDIQGIKFMLSGKLRGHHVFGSGHEWGYWQNEYCSFRMAADTSMTLRACLEDIATPMGEVAPVVVGALEEVIRLQERDLVYGDLMPWLVGTDPETEIAALAGIVFHELPPAVPAVLQWDAAQVEDWGRRVSPALAQMDRDYAAVVARLRAARGGVPEEGLPWFDEILDGVEVTGLRARHALHAYGALVLLRRAALERDPALADEGRRWLDRALADTAAALTVIRRREEGYRYQPLSRAIAGGPDGTEDENWTVYRYRYLNRTHHAFYYTRIDRLIEEAFAGGAAQVDLADALIGPDEALALDLLDPALQSPRLDPGDGTSPTQARSLRHRYASPGAYTVRAEADLDGAPFVWEAPVAALSEEAQTGFTGAISEPAGAALLDPLLPALVLGRVSDRELALGFDLNGRGAVRADQWQLLGARGADGLASAPQDLTVPIVNHATAQIQTQVQVQGAALDRDGDQLVLTGQLLTEAVITALVDVGGFEPDGARRIIAATLGYTADTLPAAVPFRVTWAAE